MPEDQNQAEASEISADQHRNYRKNSQLSFLFDIILAQT
jgi:hypothetical protein